MSHRGAYFVGNMTGLVILITVIVTQPARASHVRVAYSSLVRLSLHREAKALFPRRFHSSSLVQCGCQCEALNFDTGDTKAVCYKYNKFQRECFCRTYDALHRGYTFRGYWFMRIPGDVRCLDWARNNECWRNRVFMLKHCALACQLYTDLSYNE